MVKVKFGKTLKTFDTCGKEILSDTCGEGILSEVLDACGKGVMGVQFSFLGDGRAVLFLGWI